MATIQERISAEENMFSETVGMDESPLMRIFQSDKKDDNEKELNSIFKRLQKKICAQFIEDEFNEEPDTCLCGNKIEDHYFSQAGSATDGESLPNINRLSSSESITDPKIQTESRPTDAFGEIEFQGNGLETRAQFVRLADDTDLNDIWDLFRNVWKLNCPDILISVIGAADQFNLSSDALTFFKNGIRKIVRDKAAWIITGGTSTGVMKLVGNALQSVLETNRYSLHSYCIGIAPWGIIDQKEKLNIQRDHKAYQVKSGLHGYKCLESNHSHFLLVDNGTANKYWTELPLRLEMIKFLRDKIRISKNMKRVTLPSVSLLVGGGSHAISCVRHSLEQVFAIPVLILKNSGRAADVLEAACQLSLKAGNLLGEDDSRSHAKLEALIKKKFPEKGTSEQNSIYNDVLACVERKEYIKVCDPDDYNSDLEESIVALLADSCREDNIQQMFVALSWNSPEIARQTVLTDKHDLEMDVLNDAMGFSLQNDMVKFVELLLEKGVSVQEYFTLERLRGLYQKRIFRGNSLLKEILKDITTLRLIQKISAVTFNTVKSIVQSKIEEQEEMEEEGGHKDDEERQEKEERHADQAFFQLFIWAILNNMFDMADLMLKHGYYPLAKTLVGCCLLRRQMELSKTSEIMESLAELIQEHHRRYEAYAIELLEECHSLNAGDAWTLLYCSVPTIENQTCLDIAVLAAHRAFVAHGICQSRLSEVWMGGMRFNRWHTVKVFVRLFLPFLIAKTTFQRITRPSISHETHPTILHVPPPNEAMGTSGQESKDKEEIIKLQDILNENEPFGSGREETSEVIEEQNWCQKVVYFYTAPVTKFNVHLIHYVGFLLLYSYIVLAKLKNRTSPVEWILFVWVLSLTMEEVIQAFGYSKRNLGNSGRVWWDSIRIWFDNVWNRMDFLAIALFFVAFGLRFSDQTRVAGKVLYGVDCMLWIVRLLELFAVNKYLGPYVIMIWSMMRDLLYFLFVLGIFLWAYSVVRAAILHPFEEPTVRLIWDALYVPYLQTFGELFVERTSSGNTTVFNTQSYFLGAESLGVLLLDLYLLVANVLLLNLLIAVFNNTYSLVEANSLELWRFARYQLIHDYYKKPLLAGPLVIVYRLVQFMCWLCCRGCKTEKLCDNVFSGVTLPPNEGRRLKRFERDCMLNSITWGRELESEDQVVASKAISKDLALLKNKVITKAHEEDHLSPKEMLDRMQDIVQQRLEHAILKELTALRSCLSNATAVPRQMSDQSLVQESHSPELAVWQPENRLITLSSSVYEPDTMEEAVLIRKPEAVPIRSHTADSCRQAGPPEIESDLPSVEVYTEVVLKREDRGADSQMARRPPDSEMVPVSPAETEIPEEVEWTPVRDNERTLTCSHAISAEERDVFIPEMSVEKIEVEVPGVLQRTELEENDSRSDKEIPDSPEVETLPGVGDSYDFDPVYPCRPLEEDIYPPPREPSSTSTTELEGVEESNRLEDLADFLNTTIPETLTLIKGFVPGSHKKALTSPYPGSRMLRLAFLDANLSWHVQDSYDPPEYTSRIVLANVSWADPSTFNEICKIQFNTLDDNVDRTSYGGAYLIGKDRRPRNPVGRTGLQGRGLLARWGPNHAVKAVVTRVTQDGIQFLCTKTKNSFPMAMTQGKESLPEIIIKAFDVAKLSKVRMQRKKKEEIKAKLQSLLSNPRVAYCCYEDDARNTDNAWIETKVFYLHDESGEIFKHFVTEGNEDNDNETKDLKWAYSLESSNLNDSDREALDYVASLQHSQRLKMET